MNTATKILLAEDDMFVRNIYCEKLLKEGFEVVVAENGVKALQKLESEEGIDLIILDQMMPVMNGMEVLGKINANENWKKIPIIMLTNAAEKEQIDEGMKYGVCEYLIKSHFTPNEVVEKILNLLKGKEV